MAPAVWLRGGSLSGTNEVMNRAFQAPDREATEIHERCHRLPIAGRYEDARYGRCALLAGARGLSRM
ncbi:MAG: hypothetical protein EpisKO_00680 [Epibacterium sp.]